MVVAPYEKLNVDAPQILEPILKVCASCRIATSDPSQAQGRLIGRGFGNPRRAFLG